MPRLVLCLVVSSVPDVVLDFRYDVLADGICCSPRVILSNPSEALHLGRRFLMNDVTRILSAIDQGDPAAPEQLLPLVYEELRKLAAARLAHEKPGQTLQATALLHEAYVRLVDQKSPQRWDSRRHFFAAAAEAMRRILIESARRKSRQKHGGESCRKELDENDWITATTPDQLLAVDEALCRLSHEDPTAAEIVKLRYFAGMSLDEIAQVLDVHRATAFRQWAYARAWIRAELQPDSQPPR
jgi:RNA polymerase sigma factor (TIGR02999 family)